MRRDFLLALLFQVIVLIFFFHEPIFQHKVFSPADILQNFSPFLGERAANFRVQNELLSDPVLQMHPWLRFQGMELRQGRLPLWNPYSFAGVPHLGNMQSAVFYPLSALFYVFSLPTALLLSTFLKMLMAGSLTYAYLRKIRLGALASLFGSTAFMFCGFLVVWLHWPNASVAAFLPGLFLLVEWLFERDSRPLLPTLALGGSIGLMLLAGHPEIAFIVVTATALYFCFLLATRMLRKREYARALRLALLFAGAGFLGLLTAAIQVLPFLEYLFNSAAWAARHSETLSASFLPKKYLILFVIPNFVGNPADGIYWGAVNYNEAAMGYVGVFTLALAGLAVFFRTDPGGDRRHFFFAAVSVLFLSVIYGIGPTLDLLAKLPLFKANYNNRFLLIVAFSFSILAAMGVERLNAPTPRSALRVLPGLAAILAVLLATSIVLAKPSLFTRLIAHQDSTQRLYVTRYLVIALILTLCGGAIVFLRCFGRLSYRLTAFSLLLLLVCDLVVFFGQRYNPSIDPRLLYPRNAVLDYLRQHGGVANRTLFVDGGFPPNLSTYYGIQDIRGYDAMIPAHFLSLLRNIDQFEGLWQQVEKIQDGMLDLLNVKYLVTPTPPNLAFEDTQAIPGIPTVVMPIRADAVQTFRAMYNNLAGIRLVLSLDESHRNGAVLLDVKEAAGSAKPIRSVRVDSSRIWNDAPIVFFFEPIPNSEGRVFCFSLQTVDRPGEKPVGLRVIRPDISDTYPDGALRIGNGPALTDVRFALAYARNDGNYVEVYNGSGTRVFENRNVLPRAFVVSRARTLPDDAKILDTLCRETFDFRKEVLLKGFSPTASPSASLPLQGPPGQVEIVRYLPNEVCLAANCMEKGWLVLTDNYYPGWRAFVDNRPVGILRADYAFRAVPVEKGRHEVRFVYQPASFRIGALVSGLAGLLYLAFLLCRWIPRQAGQGVMGR